MFLLIVLAIATGTLWTRTDRMARRMQWLETRLDGLEWILHDRQEGGAKAAGETPSSSAPTPPTPASEPEPAPEPVPAPAPSDTTRKPVPSFVPAMRREEVVHSPPVDQPEPASQPEEPVETLVAADPASRRPRLDLEDLFGRLLPWTGGVALAVAGFFLVRWSIEQGLLGPGVRTALGFLFGLGLLGAAEIAYRQEHRIADPRVRQALAGAGLATLYASFYMAGSMYGLIEVTVAFLGLAGVTAAAIALSFRFGLPSAILGLVGGFAAPALVGSDEANLPLLALYLALVTGGLSFAGERQGRSWMGLAALVGGLGWGVLMLLSGVTGSADILAFGAYIVMLGAVIPAFTSGPEAPPVIRAVIAVLAALQMAVMVSIAGFDPMAWSLYLLLAAALAFFAWREPRMREASGFAAVLGLIMLGLWRGAETVPFLAVVAGLAVVFALVPLVHIWRRAERVADIAQIAIVPLALAAIACIRFAYDWSDAALALTMLGFAAIPAAASWRRWAPDDEPLGLVALLPLVPAAIGSVIAGWIMLPEWAAPIPPAIAAVGFVLLGWKREQAVLSAYGWCAIAVAGVAMGIDYRLASDETLRMAQPHPAQLAGQSLIRWAALLAGPLAMALRRVAMPSRQAGEVLAIIAFYGLVAQFLPGDMLAWFMAAAAVGIAMLPNRRIAASSTALVIAGAWALDPVAQWLVGAAGSLNGEAMMIAGTLGWHEIALHILPVVAASAALIVAVFRATEARIPLALVFGTFGVIALHIGYKQVFAIATPEQFVAYGLAERTLWQAILLGIALAAWRGVARMPELRLASGLLAGASLAHFFTYTLVMHNPMAVAQAVGPWPVFNLVAGAMGVALGAVALLRQLAQAHGQHPRRLCDVATMVLTVLLGIALLRQAFAGSILLEPPVGGTEDLLRSLLGIVLAIGFLGWGARTGSQSWRIGSLVLILLAVLKVFLLDAAGLEGLARIASFMALGFSLIGIGWFYKRLLSQPRQPGETPEAAA
ncbi:MAG: DUF2339 domain-containing protein [Sphingomonadaceae bacterium]|nr:DUF2339 domain-containing protein [Sphingomonadaceae bacterium]MCP5383215.1 DUF2339 domain-containing protein [Altererythrobacter sp.]